MPSYCWRCCYCYDIIPKQYDNCFVMVQWWDPSSNVPQATRRSPLSTSSLRKLTNTAIAWKGSRFLEHFHQERQEDDQRSFIWFFQIQRRPASLYWNIYQTKAKIILCLYPIFPSHNFDKISWFSVAFIAFRINRIIEYSAMLNHRSRMMPDGTMININ